MTRFPNLEELLFKIYDLARQNQIDEDVLKQLKREYAWKYKLSQLPTNIQLLKLYNQLVSEWKLKKNESLEALLRKRKIRSLSGIVPIQVLMKPWPCPGQCIFCPNDPSMPKSYINTEPWAMRALLNEFDPIKQVWNRLLSLSLTGHPTDKIEMIVLWWTFDAYPYEYKLEFIKWVYDACNTFDEFLKFVKIDELNPKAARFTIDYDKFDIKFSETLEEAQKINETASHRIIWLTIETRPEFVNDKNARFWRRLWVTRIEMGVQSLYDDVLVANKRGHTVKQIAEAFHKMRQYWFKISAHFMPWLYKSSVEKDIWTMKIAYSSKYFKPDEIKFYPTAVLPNTELFELYKKWEYKPLTKKELKFIINEVKDKIIPPYTRIKRLVRDIPSTEIVAWADITNLRQLILKERKENLEKLRRNSEENFKKVWGKFYKRLWADLVWIDVLQSQRVGEIITDNFRNFLKKIPEEDQILTYIFLVDVDDKILKVFKKLVETEQIYLLPRNFVCLCTRCREVRNKKSIEVWRVAEAFWRENKHFITSSVLVLRKYISSVGEEYFISFEDVLWYLYGFARLLLPDKGEAIDWEGLWKKTAIIRELHVYWQQAKIWDKWPVQHKWFGSRLMRVAEIISKEKWYTRLSVISWIWVRKYYERLGYRLEWTYMVKNL